MDGEGACRLSYPQFIHKVIHSHDRSYPQDIHNLFTGYSQVIHRVVHNGKPVETALALGFLDFADFLWLLYNTLVEKG